MGRERTETSFVIEDIVLRSGREISVAEIFSELQKIPRSASIPKKNIHMICITMSKAKRINRICRGKTYVYAAPEAEPPFMLQDVWKSYIK